MKHTWTHNPSRIIRSEHLFSLTHPPFHQKMHLSIFASHVSLNTLFTCFFFFFFYESYLQSVWGVCVCIAELECLRMSEICNFTVSFYKRPVGTSSLLALSFSAFLQRVKALWESIGQCHLQQTCIFSSHPWTQITSLWTALSMQDLQMDLSLSLSL